MDKDTIARLGVLLERSADGPWHVVEYGDGDSLIIHDARQDYRVCFMATPGETGSMDQIEANAELIAAMHKALPALLSIAERAADVEGMAAVVSGSVSRLINSSARDFEVSDTYEAVATAVSRYVLGGE